MTAHLMIANEDSCGILGVCSCWPGFACLMLGAVIHPLLRKVGNAAHVAYMTGPLPRMMLHLLIWVGWCLLPTCWHLREVDAGKDRHLCLHAAPVAPTLNLIAICATRFSMSSRCALRLPACWPLP